MARGRLPSPSAVRNSESPCCPRRCNNLLGLTNGAIYALSALGFSIIYNASGVINFAQGEFIMIGGVSAVMLTSAGVPLPLAIVLAVLIAARWSDCCWRSSPSNRRATPRSCRSSSSP